MGEQCGHAIRGYPGDACQLNQGHTGHHSMHAYTCAGCGKQRRGRPHTIGWVLNDDRDPYCFLCAGTPMLTSGRSTVKEALHA